ncbi:retrotransposon-like family member (retr-1) partial [Lentinula edodes]|uniref:Retrotransposon-like family member (Retr-1) partial n=1 Tax=Lentinula edodes TaxID=5353 RepID=A0A1Q3EI10_LENED|nr:retrotransposon-like family member (retr-1) partial [Lentinula edodes]
MDANVYEGLRNEIGGWTTTQRKFRMANGTVVPGKARWAGCINVKGVEVDGEFEVFDSGGSWKFLFGKPLLERFSAVHDYGKESIVLHGKQGNWKEVFNGRLGEVVASNATPMREEQSQRDIPRPNAIEQAVLEESAEPAGGVTVKTLTPLDREVNELHLVQQNLVTNNAGQYKPKVRPVSWRHALQIEEVPNEEPPRPQPEPGIRETMLEWNANIDSGEEQLTEAELEDWLWEARQLRREDTIKQQEALEHRQTERRKIWEEEEEKREADWVAWLRQQRAEPGLCKWFFWRNRVRNPSPPRRLRVDSLGGSNAPPSREVSADAGSPVEHHIDLVSVEHQTHDATNPIAEPTSDASRREEMRNNTKNMPDGSRADSVGGFDVPPSREVLSEVYSADPQHADQSQTVPICVLQNEEDYPSQSDMGLDFFPDALDQSEDINLFTRNDGEKGAFRPEQVREILRKVKIGSNLSVDQRLRVEKLLSTYADCFALSVGEVRPVNDAVHCLNIPEGATFPKKVRQKALTPPQREYLHAKIDELLEAGVIERCNPEDVKCVSLLTLAQKAHSGGANAQTKR